MFKENLSKVLNSLTLFFSSSSHDLPPSWIYFSIAVSIKVLINWKLSIESYLVLTFVNSVLRNGDLTDTGARQNWYRTRRGRSIWSINVASSLKFSNPHRKYISLFTVDMYWKIPWKRWFIFDSNQWNENSIWHVKLIVLSWFYHNTSSYHKLKMHPWTQHKSITGTRSIVYYIHLRKTSKFINKSCILVTIIHMYFSAYQNITHAKVGKIEIKLLQLFNSR